MGPPQAELNGPSKGWVEEWNLWEKEKCPINNLKRGSEMQKKEAKAGAEERLPPSPGMAGLFFF